MAPAKTPEYGSDTKSGSGSTNLAICFSFFVLEFLFYLLIFCFIKISKFLVFI